MTKLSLEAILALVRRLRTQQMKVSFDGLDQQAMKEGIKISRQTLVQPEDISLTPYSKNALEQLDKKDYLKVTDGVSAMEKYYEAETLKLLKKYCPNKNKDYDMAADPWDYKNYEVDCWRNFKKGTDVRHVKPGMNKLREQGFAKFYSPMKELNASEMFREEKDLWEEIIKLIDSAVPSVKSSLSWEEVSLPFMTKHTNVGYPYFRNDRNIDTKTGKSYGQLTSDIAKRMQPKDVVAYPYVAFGRNLRGKARPILGGSRIQALVFNQLEKPEIEAYKQKSPLYIGYNSDDILKRKMIILGNYLKRNSSLTCINRDYSAFDTTVNVELRRIVDAISILKAGDSRAQDIAFWRGVSHYKSLLLNGLTHKTTPIYCRIFSGELDTNRAGGLVNAIADFYAILTLWPNFTEVFYKLKAQGSSALFVMGDDNLLVQPRNLSNEKYSSILKRKFGLDVSHEKGEYGLYFLQRRLFFKDGKWTMITPFTRVIRSLISKENRKGLGPAGWTIATYMLLDQLREWPELMLDVARIFAKYDEYKLGTVWSVKQMTKMVADEDKKAISEGKKSTTTHVKLYDGDPLKQGYFNSDGSVNERFLSRIHNILTRGLSRKAK